MTLRQCPELYSFFSVLNKLNLANTYVFLLHEENFNEAFS